MNPTEEQASIIHSWKTTKSSIMVSAYAGCAKTTTLELLGKEIRVPALALAFNKKIKDELAARFPPNFQVQTMNSLGFQALRRALPAVQKWDIDDRKIGKLVSQALKEQSIDATEDQWALVRALVSAVMNAGVVPKEISATGGLLPDEPEVWKSIADDLFIPKEDFALLLPVARQTIIDSIRLVPRGVISFDDQIYYPALISGRFIPYPVVLVDEAQDLSPLNRELIRKSIGAASRLIVVGDPKQAIYAFRGADSLSMQRLRALREEWIDLPLTLTWRCPRAIVARQQAHAPGFRAAPTAPDGVFARLEVPSEVEGEAFWSWSDLESRARPGDRIAILCRNNAPILKLAFKLLRQQIGVSMLGRDLAGGLAAHAKKLFKSDTDASEMRKILDEYLETETSKLGEGDEAKIDSISDRVESLRAILDGSGARTGAELQSAIRQVFSKENGRVELGSIHRAKGLEWDVVVHLDPWRLPSKSARDAAKKGNEVPLEQERNLKYVCETRTKFALFEANVEEFI
ncbi:UvrD-helicase domain-containing protein [Patescibacteria group bacterium]|jgi:superfamily I DNA/RNA helicase|nr:UvrD-helicase domain-containing protein [Patescibacteria group bacterium]